MGWPENGGNDEVIVMRTAWIIVWLCLWTTPIAEAKERPIPEVVMTKPSEDRESASRAYAGATADMKTWDKSRPLPTSWQEAGLQDDAELVFDRGYYDGGSRGFFFKDSTDHYFLLSEFTPPRWA